MIRLLKHEAVAGRGSFEVAFLDGRPSRFFYFEDVAGRRLRPDMVDSQTALAQAKAFAGANEIEPMARKPLDLPPEVAKAFVADMRAFTPLAALAQRPMESLLASSMC